MGAAWVFVMDIPSGMLCQLLCCTTLPTKAMTPLWCKAVPKQGRIAELESLLSCCCQAVVGMLLVLLVLLLVGGVSLFASYS